MYTGHQEGEFISGVFTREQKDGSRRMILNLKKLNKFVQYNHFKMETINNVFDILRPGAYMASIDLKDAFYSVTIYGPHQKILKFSIDENFCCLYAEWLCSSYENIY